MQWITSAENIEKEIERNGDKVRKVKSDSIFSFQKFTNSTISSGVLNYC